MLGGNTGRTVCDARVQDFSVVVMAVWGVNEIGAGVDRYVILDQGLDR